MVKTLSKANNKKPDQYNATDLLHYWEKIWLQTHMQRYQSNTYQGYELHCLKGLLSMYNIYTILLAIHNCLKNGKCSIHHFSEHFVEYVQETQFPFIIYATKYGGAKIAEDKLLQLEALESKWFATPKDDAKLRHLAIELEAQCLRNQSE